MIQQIGLFPHLTVADNIATVPRLLGWDKRADAARVDELLELIGMDPEEIGPRYPAQLSGGQRQRVGVARALAADPPLMLMDEPFGAIDPINRSRLQDEFLRLQEQVRKTVVFVTHDIDEAIKMGDRIAILRQGGVLAQYDTPERILTNPADDFVAEFVGADRALKRLGLATLADVELLAQRTASRRERAQAAARPSATRSRSCWPTAASRWRSSTRTATWPGRHARAARRPAGQRRAIGARDRAVSLVLAAGGPVIPSFGGAARRSPASAPTGCSARTGSSRTGAPLLWPALRQHVVLTLIAVSIGFVISTALALIAYRRGWFERPVLIVTSILYTIPSLALFELLEPRARARPEPDHGRGRARLLHAADHVPQHAHRPAGGAGRGPRRRGRAWAWGATQSLLRVELPLALPAIIAGLRIATVTVISLATVASLIDNEGLGVPILDADLQQRVQDRADRRRRAGRRCWRSSPTGCW